MQVLTNLEEVRSYLVSAYARNTPQLEQ